MLVQLTRRQLHLSMGSYIARRTKVKSAPFEIDYTKFVDSLNH